MSDKKTKIFYSTDGINWTWVTLPLTTGERIVNISTSGNSFVVSTTHNRLLYSTDALNWIETYSSVATKLSYPQLRSVNEVYIVTGLTEGTFGSADGGKTWVKSNFN